MGKGLPHYYDRVMKPLEQMKFKQIRKELLNNAVGRVLEIGSGTGANFPYYTNAMQVDAIEPNNQMLEQSLKRQWETKTPIKTYLVQAEKLPFSDNTFDSVVATLVFCTIPDPEKALREIHRVSKPGAEILIFEHVKMRNSLLGKLQDILTPLWKKICDGCHLNRDTLTTLERSPLAIMSIDSYYKGLLVTVKCVNNKQ
ncbi:class I SAM-dependent methyltransferase [Gracilibacillus sp. YIM 98692]|uniref:class I SAM-dependent methyltransferase n=1 Tax=Gracilibacillus sp. YIM 98692 TaxID=2663532 RepID=UPI0013D7FCFD|nr:class I SAM-dependent methyltransferase [Gracilibacillus sp. YIM 98692]